MEPITEERMREIQKQINLYVDDRLYANSESVKNYVAEIKEAMNYHAKEQYKNSRYYIFVNSTLNGIVVGISIAIVLHFMK